MNFTGDLLLNEDVDLNDVSVASFSSPVPTRVSAPALSAHLHALDQAVAGPSLIGDGIGEPPDNEDGDIRTTPIGSTTNIVPFQSRPPSSSPSLPPQPPVSESISGLKSVTTPQTPGANGASSKQQRLRITTDTEKIVV
jgi:hypothetical protein